MESVFLDFETLDRGDIDVSRLMRVLPGTKLFESTPAAELVERIRDARFVILNKVSLDDESLEQAPHLKLVCLAATGTDNIDLKAARKLGIGVCNIRAYCTASVVQHVFAMILSLTQHLGQYHALLKGGAWKDSPQFCMLDYPIRELQGRILGIVGFGELGQAVARMGEAFGMRIMVANRPGLPPQDGRVDLAQLLAEADVLSLHCPLTPETAGLLGAAELAQMKPDALVINTARGGLVDAWWTRMFRI
jgi:glycerate dehydrogenase